MSSAIEVEGKSFIVLFVTAGSESATWKKVLNLFTVEAVPWFFIDEYKLTEIPTVAIAGVGVSAMRSGVFGISLGQGRVVWIPGSFGHKSFGVSLGQGSVV